jgi:hypothetical protein
LEDLGNAARFAQDSLENCAGHGLISRDEVEQFLGEVNRLSRWLEALADELFNRGGV